MATSVQLLQHYQANKPGDVVSLADDVAAILVRQQWAFLTGTSVTQVSPRADFVSSTLGPPTQGIFPAGATVLDSFGNQWYTPAGGNAPTDWKAVNGIIYGSGAPATTLGAVGNYYLRSDTPSTANQRIYVKTAAAVWTAIL